MTRLTDKQQWELFIPEMGYMALLRNLRNFDNANIDPRLAVKIGEKLASPAEVARSKQFPYAFHTAWLNVPSVKWKKYLDKALDLSVPNIPVLDGRNLILVDTSSSMTAELSSHTRAVQNMRRKKFINPQTGEDAFLDVKTPSCVDAAALFGIALGVRNPGKVDLWSFATGQEDLTALTNPPPGEGVLSSMEIFTNRIGMVGHGTDISGSLRATYQGHDRVFIFTDMQSMPDESNPYYGDVTASVPGDKHVYGFNLAGYSNSSMNTGSYRHEMGGLTDATFSLIKNIEDGVAGSYPWQ